MKIYATTLLVMSLLAHLCSPRALYASANFRLEQSTVYTFDETGNASVKKIIQLENLTTNIYPAVYYLDLPADATNVIAVDEEGKLDATSTQELGQKQVKIPLKKEAFGLHKNLSFVLTYDTRSLAARVDTFWTITIPPFSSDEEIAKYEVTLVLPPVWGSPLRIAPPSANPYTWTYQELTNSPITISYQPLPTVAEPTEAPAPQKTFDIGAGIALGVMVLLIIYFVGSKPMK